MRISKTEIGVNHPPFIIAEMSGNHNKSLERALRIVEAVAQSGAHALKLQTYTPDTITLNIKDGDFLIKDKNSLWAGKSLYDLYEEAHTPWDWHEPIMKLAQKLGMICFSTPFDETSVDFLEELNVPAYKVASLENNHLPLLTKIAKTGKPIILSTGLASIADLHDMIHTIKNAGCNDYALLKCTSSYPASPRNSNVLTIPHMRKMFDCEIGLSDHTLGIGAPIAAIAHGATIIEKHFTLSRDDGGVDSAFSLEPKEFQNLVIESDRAWKSLGKIFYGNTKKEKSSLVFRRSLFISQDMKKGEIFNKKNLRIVRPGTGLPPKYFELFLGKRIIRDVNKGTPLSWDLV
tara:strand:+ start:6572 stop:7612 length:1041 start_codon:yes stop_codon:yes gene_type:complete